MNSLIDILLINFTPNLLRLLIIPIFIFAAILDYKKRIVYNQIWVPAIGLLLVVLLWDFIILTTQSSDTITHYLHSLSLSIILGPSIATVGVWTALAQNPLPTGIAFVGFMLGICSHLVGDMLTEAYDYTVTPFWPASSRAYTLGWTTADSTVWNWGLLASGTFALTLTAMAIRLIS
jgi:membrane-bound metal-dependent hydrolase YbcI (DUF457 family)